MTFFDKVIKSREKQIKNSKYNHGMIFYLWFEWMSGRLRFNLISDFHAKLPFKCKLSEVNSIVNIIIDFLDYDYHDGLPINPDEKGSTQLNIKVSIHELKIFVKYLPE